MSAKTKTPDFELMVYVARAYHLTAEHLWLFATVDQIECMQYMFGSEPRYKFLERAIGSQIEDNGLGIHGRAVEALFVQILEIAPKISESTQKILTKIKGYAESGGDAQDLLSVLSEELKAKLEGKSRPQDEDLVRSIGSYWVVISVLRALAAEIMLKALVYKKTGSYEETHNLEELFKNLQRVLQDVSNADTKKRIEDLEIQHKIDLRKTFEEHKGDFVAWRYVYENPGVRTKVPDMTKALEILDTLISDELSRDGSEVSSPGTPTG